MSIHKKKLFTTYFNLQMPMYKTLDLETSSSGEVTGVGDSDNVLRPHKQHSGSPSKDNPSVTDDNCMKDSANYQVHTLILR